MNGTGKDVIVVGAGGRSGHRIVEEALRAGHHEHRWSRRAPTLAL